MPRDVLGHCRDCGAGPEDPCMCDITVALDLARALAGLVCEECTGDGFCNGCRGDGRVLVRALGSSATCADCGGSGNCPECDGTGRIGAQA